MSDTCGRANSIWIRIHVDVEIFESGKKKLPIRVDGASNSLILPRLARLWETQVQRPGTLPRLLKNGKDHANWLQRSSSSLSFLLFPFDRPLISLVIFSECSDKCAHPHAWNLREVWRHVTMVAKFLDHNNRELKQRRRWRQRERQKKQ